MFIMCLVLGNDVISLESRSLIFVYLYARTFHDMLFFVVHGFLTFVVISCNGTLSNIILNYFALFILSFSTNQLECFHWLYYYNKHAILLAKPANTRWSRN